MPNNKNNIYSFNQSELTSKFIEIGLKSFISKQVWAWIYHRGVVDFNKMSNISKNNALILSNNFEIQKPIISTQKTSFDATIKFLVKFIDNREVESVYIPEETRATICISSQVGCTLSCKFCHTGTQTLVRNLEASEIVGQVLLAKDLIDDWSPKNRKLTNIVFMGMGEPFFNYKNLKQAIEILTDPNGLNFPKKRITISTSGLVPEILQCSKELKTNLAISLHATNDKIRTDIMAINKKYPLHDLLSACKIYNQENPQQKITFEYVALSGINDSEEQAFELVKLIKKYNLNCKINLIPFNPWKGCDYTSSRLIQISKFREILIKNNLIATIRKTRGEDVMGACGQLKSISERSKKGNNNLN